MHRVPSSDARIAANIANSRKSTGPRTEGGKQKVAANARKHGFTGSRFFCPAALQPLLDEIEHEYRAALRPQGFLEEDAFLQLRNARFQMERAQLLMDDLGRESEARNLDPLADPERGKTYLLFHRYFQQAQSSFHRFLRLLRQLQTERHLRAEMQAAEEIPALVAAKPVLKLARQRDRQRDRQLHQQAKQEAKQREVQALEILASFLHRPYSSGSQSKPPVVDAA